MKPLYNQLMDSKSAPRVAAKANTTQLGTVPMNLRSAMQKYAAGGGVSQATDTTASQTRRSINLTPYDYKAPQNQTMEKIPGVAGDPDKDGKVIVFWDHANKRVVVSDEGYWNEFSAVGEELKAAVDWAHSIGYQAGVVTTPYASDRFGDKVRTAGNFKRFHEPASDDELRAYVDAADFVVTDPYLINADTSTPEMQDNFANFTKNVGDYANSKGKDTWLVLQGFNESVDPKIVQAYNDRLTTENANRYQNLSFYTPEELQDDKNNPNRPDLEKTFQLAHTNTLKQVMADPNSSLYNPVSTNSSMLAGTAQDKDNRYNEYLNSGASDSQIRQAVDIAGGAPQSDADWKYLQSLSAQQQPQGMMAQAQPQGMTGIAALGGEQPYSGYQTGDSGIPGNEMNVINPVQTRPVQTDYGNNLGVPVPQTGGYDQLPPAQQQADNYLNQFNNLMVGQTPTPAAPDYSRSYAALGGADVVNGLRNQFLQSGLDENTIGSIFSQYYAPEQIAQAPAQQPAQQMARGGMAQSDIEQYLTSLGMVRK
jgi:hypothetical protein